MRRRRRLGERYLIKYVYFTNQSRVYSFFWGEHYEYGRVRFVRYPVFFYFMPLLNYCTGISTDLEPVALAGDLIGFHE